ncbi:hypothetical protein E2C01_030283 [Portunus trituberculatus]|uniref:Uncharacterized protein n=1 Tax=Portunus trituberculatus TaxID=210409 RepID=A0A5B7EUG1_PORTR|nr:hypothetical protein [Portunus trituberculatus]
MDDGVTITHSSRKTVTGAECEPLSCPAEYKRSLVLSPVLKLGVASRESCARHESLPSSGGGQLGARSRLGNTCGREEQRETH